MQIPSVEKLRNESPGGQSRFAQSGFTESGFTESGFTMIEMTVAMVVFAIVLVSIYGLLEVGRSARFNTMESNEATQDVRVGLNRIGVDVLNAGVDYPVTSGAAPLTPHLWMTTNLLIAPEAYTKGDYLSPVVPGPQLNSLINTTSGTSVTTKTDQVTLVSTDNTFNGGNPLRITAMNTSNGYMTLVSPQVNTACNIGDLLFVNSPANGLGVICMVTDKPSGARANDTIVTGTDPMGVNDLMAGALGNMAGVGTPAGAQRITMVTYHVVDDGSGQGTGTLMRTVWGGNNGSTAIKSSDQPISFDVTAMNIQYYLQNGTITSSPQDLDFPNVRQLTITITVRSPRKDPVTGLNNIDTLTATFNTRNLGFETNG
jgi:prepilin-type N-terminal cleavage/methylation domain-containing protein